MMRKVLVLIFFILPFFAGQFCEAQIIYDNRPAIWPSIGIRKSFGDHWRIKAEHSTRLKFRPFSVDEWYLQGGVEYAINPQISLELVYRFSEANDLEDGFMPAHRLSVEADFETHIKRFYMAFHPAVQATFGRENLMHNMNPLWCFRPKGTFKYNIAKTSLEPFMSLELFAGQRPEQSFSIYKYRASLGANYNLTDHWRFSGFLRQQGGVFTSDISSYSILGLEFTYRL
jgi:hypothetical protein